MVPVSTTAAALVVWLTTVGTAGAVVSMVTGSGAAGLTLPDGSVAVML